MNNQLVSSSSFSSPPSWEYDVFLSFRGEDTRTNFTDHFYKALDDKGINTFIDRQLKRGEEISPALLEAIEESRMSIIVFSENYASSRWCLDELVHILECRKSRQQIVWPVFYKVDPSDVRKQTSNFGDAFTKLKCKFEDNQEKILTWTSALKDAANLSGHTFKEGEYEATFISKIVKEILVLVLQRTQLPVANHPVGMESCVNEVEELLGVGGNDPCVVGIWGASGIGKTTVAKAVYNAIAYKFEGSCFLANVQETSMQYGGLLQLQNTLLSEITGSKWKVVNPHRGNSLIEKLLRRKKILLILDDVDDLEQLNNLVQVKWLSEGSRVIITTKNKGLLKSYDVELIYEVRKLEYDKALELLSWNAFGEKEPSDDYLGLARRAIAYAQGHPLAINLIGSYLRNKSLDRWQAMLDSYDSYGGEPYTGIQRILRKSYDAWDYVAQQVFLDIACFFKGEDKDYVLHILRSLNLYVPPDCLEELVEKAIITIEDNKILMHDLLEKMGKRIIYEESPNEPGERSRLWRHEDVYRVLTENRGIKQIKGIVVKLPKPYVDSSLRPVFALNSTGGGGVGGQEGEKFSLIKLASLIEVFAKKGTKDVNLRNKLMDQIEWLPYSIGKLSRLVSLDFSENRILDLPTTIGGLSSLTKLDLHSNRIAQLPDTIGELLSLVSLDLRANNLTALPATFGGLVHLEKLDLSSNRLSVLPDSVGSLASLKTLNVETNDIEEIPHTIGHCTSLKELRADYNRLKALPEAVGKIESLEVLSVRYNNIKQLPTTLSSLSLRELDVSFNELESVPESLCFATSLVKLNIGNNFADLRSLPRSIGNLEMLEELDISNNQIRVLPDSFRMLIRLRRVLPDSFTMLTRLRVLNVEENPLEVPPRHIAEMGAQAVVQYMAELVTKRDVKRKKTRAQKGIPSVSMLDEKRDYESTSTNMVGF